MRHLTFLLVAFVLMLQHNVSFACAVCFGDPNSKMMQGMNSAIFVLLGFIGFLLVSFGAFFLNFKSRSRKYDLIMEQSTEAQTTGDVNL